MKKMITSDFEFFFSLNPKAMGHLSQFIDELIRIKGTKAETKEMEIDKMLDKVFVFFRFIQQKDVFEHLYRQLLAKRLLLHKPFNKDCENKLVSKIKVQFLLCHLLFDVFNLFYVLTDGMRRRVHFETWENGQRCFRIRSHVERV